MMTTADAWLIPAIPILSAFVVLLFIRPLIPNIAGVVATLSVGASAVLSIMLAVTYSGFMMSAPITASSIEWMRFQPGLVARMGVYIDPLSLLLMIVVTSVSFLVHLYSIGYMRGEEGFARYFGYLNLFTGVMLGLVVSTNIVQMYIFWELVGLSSFLLIGFYYDRPSAVAASKKAFIVTRFADLGFFLGILLVGYYSFAVLGSPEPFEFNTLTDPAMLARFGALEPILGIHPLTLAAILIFIGAAGKSAMFPLHIWLPDAMEGPTPVSALIHAATMVVAGVYLVARLFPLFACAGPALELIAIIGAFTCIFAAAIAGTQDDIKRVLAFSTLSQIGYMMLALGVATLTDPAGYSASLFHLATHAFFKALLFLGAGSLIHAVHSNNLQDMGGLRRVMPITHLTFLIAVLAIAGIPPFAGFFSKDAILLAALQSGHLAIFGIGVVVAGLTAFYMARVYFLAFWGERRSGRHAHESPWTMTVPLLALMGLSMVSGFLPIEKWVSVGSGVLHPEAYAMHNLVAVIGTAMAVLGIAVAWNLHARADAHGALYRVLKQKFYIDEIYLFITHRIIFRLVAAPIAWFDRNVVDGAVNVSGRIVAASSRVLALLQTGQVQTHGAWMAGGGSFAALLIWWLL